MQVNLIDFAGTRWVDDKGMLTPTAQLFMQQLQRALAINFSTEGCVVPSLSSAHTATWPAGQVAVVAPNAVPGTLIFDIASVNGGGGPPANGQLMVRLEDGNFHYVTNT